MHVLSSARIKLGSKLGHFLPVFSWGSLVILSAAIKFNGCYESVAVPVCGRSDQISFMLIVANLTDSKCTAFLFHITMLKIYSKQHLFKFLPVKLSLATHNSPISCKSAVCNMLPTQWHMYHNMHIIPWYNLFCFGHWIVYHKRKKYCLIKIMVQPVGIRLMSGISVGLTSAGLFWDWPVCC